MLRKFNPEGMMSPPYYSHAALVTGGTQTLYVAGQVGVGPDGTVPEGIVEQAQLAVASLKAVLAGADMTPADIAKLTIYLTDAADMEGFMQGAAGIVSSPAAPATLLVVKALAMPNLRCEIEAIAVK